MPRKKVSKAKRVVRKTRTKRLSSRFAQKINWTESYSSFLLGVVVVIVAILFGVTIIRQQTHVRETSSISTGPTATITPSPTPGTTMTEHGNTYYIVKPNDSLWDIAVAVYNDGYKWTEIAKANNLANPGTIFTGDKLLLPNAPKPSELGQLTSTTYTVQKDDSLWSIAVRAYGDGYQWVKIAKANNLANPDLIFSGNVLTLPR